MTLQTVRTALIDSVVAPAVAGAVQQVRAHRGQFRSLEEIKKIAVRNTAVLVAYRGFQNVERHHDQFIADVVWVAYSIAQDLSVKNDRNKTAGLIAEVLAGVISREAGNLSNAQEDPKRLSAKNVSTLAIDKMGLSIWEVTWTQSMTILPEELAISLDDFEGFDGKHFETSVDTNLADPLMESEEHY